MRRLISVLAVGMLMVLFIVMARAQGPAGPAFASKMLVNNERVQIQRLSVPAGFGRRCRWSRTTRSRSR